MSRLLLGLLLGLSVHVATVPAASAATSQVPARYGLALLGGTAYDPNGFALGLVQGFALFDYDQVVFWHEAPDDLRLRVEGSLGLADRQGGRAMAAVNILAFKYLDRYAGVGWRPYLEGGIGVIYTDFQVDGQGLRVNFNPQAGAGVEWAAADGRAVQAGLRFHHISNSGFHEDNRGINSVLFMAGWLFP